MISNNYDNKTAFGVKIDKRLVKTMRKDIIEGAKKATNEYEVFSAKSAKEDLEKFLTHYNNPNDNVIIKQSRFSPDILLVHEKDPIISKKVGYRDKKKSNYISNLLGDSNISGVQSIQRQEKEMEKTLAEKEKFVGKKSLSDKISDYFTILFNKIH